MVVAAATVAATARFDEKRFHFVLQPVDATARSQVTMEESAIVRPRDINVILEQTGVWWMRYYAKSDHDRCELHEQVEMHDLERNIVEKMAIEGPLPDCVAIGVGSPTVPKTSPAPMPSSIASVVAGPLACAAAVQPFARVAYTRLAPLVPGGAPPLQTVAHYRAEHIEIDCDNDAHHGVPCSPPVK